MNSKMQVNNPLSMLSWDDIKLFLTVGERGSFSAAARALKLGQPTLSRRMADLEQQLGEPLFIRQSQGCSLTQLGERLWPAAEKMAQWAQEAEIAVSQAQHTVQGKVRITAPPGVAFALVPQIAALLANTNPNIQLEVISSLDNLNLGRGEADLALRIANDPSQELICLAQIRSRHCVYAAQAYVDSLKAEPNLADLRWICWSQQYNHLKVNQILEQNITHFTPAFSSDDYNVQLAACYSGVGAMVIPSAFQSHPMLTQLVEVPIDISAHDDGELYLLAHKRQAYLPKVKAVAQAVEQCFKALKAYC